MGPSEDRWYFDSVHTTLSLLSAMLTYKYLFNSNKPKDRLRAATIS